MKKLLILLFISTSVWANSEPSLEELLDVALINPSSNVDTSTASKFSQRIQDAPSAVRVMSRDEIAEYGYRTLGEILRSLPGLNTSYDYQNTFLGARGIAIPGDYNTRVLILIDGIRINNNVFDSAFVGNEFPLDIDLIDRVEYAPGPGSAIYGNNAFFGVVNVISRGAANLHGSEASAEYGSFNTYKLRASTGQRLDNGAEYLLSASQFYRGGPDRPAYMDYAVPFANFQGNPAMDEDLSQYLFAKLNWQGLQLTGAYSQREKTNPVLLASAEPYLWIMNGRSVNKNQHGFIGAGYEFDLFKHLNVQLRLNYHEEEYQGSHPLYINPDLSANYKENAKGRWLDGELQAVYKQWQGHNILFGADLRWNREQYWHSYLENIETGLQNKNQGSYFAAFIQDEISINEELKLIAGGRYDYTEFGHHFNPRLGLVWNPLDKTSFKLLYGSAFRNPNFYEKTLNTYFQNLSVKAEKINTLELTAEHYFSPSTKFNSSIYHYEMKDLIGQVGLNNGAPAYLNLNRVISNGWEAELEQRFAGDVRTKIAYALQKTTLDEQEVINSPRHMLNLKISAPVFHPDWKLAGEARYLSAYDIFNGRLDAQWLADINLTGKINKHCSLALSVHNLADVSYYEATRLMNYDSYSARQDGRDIRLKINVSY